MTLLSFNYFVVDLQMIDSKNTALYIKQTFYFIFLINLPDLASHLTCDALRDSSSVSCSTFSSFTFFGPAWCFITS